MKTEIPVRTVDPNERPEISYQKARQEDLKTHDINYGFCHTENEQKNSRSFSSDAKNIVIALLGTILVLSIVLQITKDTTIQDAFDTIKSQKEYIKSQDQTITKMCSNVKKAQGEIVKQVMILKKAKAISNPIINSGSICDSIQ